jgi:PAS domain S-box-containing protein
MNNNEKDQAELVRENEALRRLVATLAAEAQRFKTTLHSIGDAVISADAYGTVLEMNPVAEALTGWSEIEAQGRPVAEVFKLVDEESRSEVESPVARVLREGAMVGLADHALLVARDGRERPIADSGAPIYDEQGTLTGVVLVFRDRTEERAAQRALTTALARQQALLASVPDIIMEVDTNRAYTWANQPGMEFFGSDVVGREAAFYFEGEQDTYERVRPLFQGDEQTFCVESWQRRRDGARRLLAWWCRALKDQAGNVTGALSTARDVTEERHAVAALAASEARYRSYVDVTGQIGWVTNPDGEVVEDVPSLRRFTGQTQEEAQGSGWASALHPDDRERVLQAWHSAVATKSAYEIECRMRRHDGVYRYLLTRGFPVSATDGTTREWVGTCIDITERKQIQAALAQSEANFRLLTEKTAVGIYVIQDGKLAYVNPSFAKTFGYLQQEINGKLTLEDLIHPDDLPVVMTKVQERMGGRTEATSSVYRAIKQDGSLVHIEVHGMLLQFQGRPAIVGTLSDITERLRTEAALKMSEEQFRQLTEGSPVGIYIIQDGKFVYVNPRLAEGAGYSREDIIGQLGPRELTHPDDLALAMRTIGERMAGKVADRGTEYRVIRKDGSLVHVEAYGRLTEYQGRAAVMGTLIDVTERKRAEEELLNKTAVLEAQANSTIDGILVVDGQGRKVFQNERTVELWKIPPDIANDSDDQVQVRHFMHSTECPERFVEQMVYLYSHPDETSRDEIELVDGTVLDRYSAPVLGKDGTNYGRIWTFRDITARKRAEQERESLEEQIRASQKMEAIGSLAGGVAHDFNNLLSVMLSFVGFALQALPEGDPVRNDLLEVKKAGERAATLTRQLVAFSRKQVLRPVPLSLNQIAAGVEKMLRRVLGEDIDLVQVLAPDLGLTLADPSQIEQVLMNLVVNARDAMPAGGKLTIETSNIEIDEGYAARHVAVKPGSYVQLAVTDTGSGMDERTRLRIFDPFFTTKEKGKGTGLGLSTVYGIVRQSGGNIWVHSEPGQGTTFKVYLPRELGATAPTTRAPPTVSLQPPGAETILVVEDEEALRSVARRILEAAGYTVLTAADGNDAVLTSAEHAGDIHLLVTDVVMPRMGGSALAQELAKTRPTLQVLYVSGYTDDAIVHHGVLDAGTQFLAKPFTAADLVRKVREVLDSGVANLADGHEQTVQADADMQEQPLDRDALRALPPDVLGNLHQAVLAARYDQIVELVETLRGTQPDVAARLRRLADRFDYDGMRDLLRTCRTRICP